jgi:hypothetical protein
LVSFAHLPFQWEAEIGKASWDGIDKIPSGDWMNYLRWQRRALNLPVRNEIKLQLFEPLDSGIYRLHFNEAGVPCKTVLVHLYVHISQVIDFHHLCFFLNRYRYTTARLHQKQP